MNDSALELDGSPFEQGSLATEAYYWDPGPELAAGATISRPTAQVLRYVLSAGYGPQLGAGTDVTSSVLVGGAAFLGAGDYANMVGVQVTALQQGYAYRVFMTCASSDGNTPERFLTIECRKE